jgi:hypothetical protein
MPDVGPQVDTTHLPSSLNTTLCTLIPGPGDHFDFVRMPGHTGAIANGLLTTQSEEDPCNLASFVEGFHRIEIGAGNVSAADDADADFFHHFPL